jgi:uncharacterized membrane protein
MQNKDNKIIIILSIVLLILDFIYITIFSDIFKKQIFKVQNKTLNLKFNSTLLCYIFIILGLYYFIVKENKPLTDAFLLGIFVYGVYELTTISLLTDWEWKTVILDTLWGGILFTLSVYFTRKLI